MGHRLSRIVTRTGDAGDTGLATGARVRKTHPRVAAMGDVDELNSQIGVLLAQRLPGGLAAMLERVQHELFDLGGELAMPGAVLVTSARIAALERDIGTLNAKLPPLKEFVLPGGNAAAAHAHLARAVCRRAERAVWAVYEAEKGDSPQFPEDADGEWGQSPRYLNRLSDLLFVAARTLARARGGRERQWHGASPGRR